MVELVYPFDITVAKGGTKLAPQTFNLTIPPRIVEAVEVWMPAGSNGEVHWALGMAGTPILPENAYAFIQGNNEVIHWPLDNMPSSGAWQLFAYNTGNYSHLLHVRILTHPLFRSAPLAGPTFIDQVTLQGDGSGFGTGGAGGGTAYSFTLEQPGALQVAPGGSNSTTLVVDEVGQRPGPYSLAFQGAPAGLTITTPAPAVPTVLPLAVTATSKLALGTYTVTCTVSNAGLLQTVQLQVVVSTTAGGGGGGGGGGGSGGIQSIAVDDSTHHVADGTRFQLVGARFAANSQIAVFDANGNLESQISSDAQGGFTYPAGSSYEIHTGSSYYWRFCVPVYGGYAGCHSVTVVVP